MRDQGTGRGSRRWRNAAVVRELDRPRVRGLWTWLIWFVAALTPTAVYLLQQMEYVTVRYRIEELRREQAEVREYERRLRVERATLESLPRVEARATRDLGLVHPAPEQVVVVGPSVSRSPGLMARAPDGDGQAR